METAGKDIDDDTVRDLMKENGIGRPSTRASIIETLFRRNYIVRNKKQILPTSVGIDLIDTIQNQMLKSAELTGSWERKLKEIEKGEYKAGSFIKQMKNMVDQLVYEVRSDNRPRNISSAHKPIATATKKVNASAAFVQGHTCPRCKKGVLMKGSKAFGCNQFKEGCDFLLPFTFMDKKVSEKQYIRLVTKGETVHLKGFIQNGEKIDGKLKFSENGELTIVPKVSKQNTDLKNRCPKCKKGTILKGSNASGCSDYKNGCGFVFPFEKLRKLAAVNKLTKELVYKIITNAANWVN